MAIQDIRAYSHLSDDDIEDIGQRLEAIYREHRDSLGDEDAAYIYRLIRLQRSLDLGGRALALSGPAFVLPGAALLGVAKILENLEIGHNVMHGQWDWMNDPEVHSSTWEWDNSGPAAGWKHSHNVMHHTFTNILGMDNDIGYGVLRITRDRRWTPSTLLQPVTNIVLASAFQYAVGFYDVELGRYFAGKQSWEETKPRLHATLRKVGSQVTKDYVAYPGIAGALAAARYGVRRAVGRRWLGASRASRQTGTPGAESLGRAVRRGATAALVAAVLGNFTRNLWAYAVIFCGHFPDDVETFTKRTLDEESRAEWYLRQMLGSANFRGGKLLTIMSGNLNYQIEHHLFPDMPSNRLARIGKQVERIAEEYGLPYNTDSFPRQFLAVQRTILKLSLPNSFLRATPDNAPEVRSDAAFTQNPEIAAQVGQRQLRKGLALLKQARPRWLA